MLSTAHFAVAVMLAIGVAGGCSTAPRTREGKDELTRRAAAGLRDLEGEVPGAEWFAARSGGYAMFPSVGKAGIGVGGAYGRGVVYEDGRLIGYADVVHASLGAQIGGQAYQALIVFDSKAALERFKQGRFEFSADTSGVLIAGGYAAHVQLVEGATIFLRPIGGAMGEASMGAVRYTFVPAEDVQPARPLPSAGAR